MPKNKSKLYVIFVYIRKVKFFMKQKVNFNKKRSTSRIGLYSDYYDDDDDGIFFDFPD